MIKISKNIHYFIISLYLITGFIPNLESIDKITTQFVYLSIINLIAFTFSFFQNNLKISFSKPYKLEYLISLIFILWCAISIFYSINKVETIINLIRLFTIASSALLILNSLKFVELKKILYIYLTILVVEIFLPFWAYLEIIKYENFQFKLSNFLKTFTGNKNITSAAIAIKTPLILFFLNEIKSIFFRCVFIIIISIAIYDIILISSRSVFISISIFILIIPFLLFYKYKQDILTKISSYFLFIIPIILITIFSIIQFSSENTVSLQNRITTINTEDASTNERIRFYKHGLDHIVKNPIIGVGLGNWKLKGIEYDKEFIQSYIVPYHMHNDFLQYFTELGIIGFLLYLFIFIVLAKKLFVRFLVSKENSFYYLFLIGSLIIFFIDSNLNFPYHRPIMMINFVFIMALTNYYEKK